MSLKLNHYKHFNVYLSSFPDSAGLKLGMYSKLLALSYLPKFSPSCNLSIHIEKEEDYMKRNFTFWIFQLINLHNPR